MSNGDYAERARTARVRDRATWTVAGLSAAATTCTVAATLGLAAALPMPPAEQADASGAQPALPASSPPPTGATGGAAPAQPEKAQPGSQAPSLQVPTMAPKERRKTTTAPRRSQQQQQDAPRTSGS